MDWVYACVWRERFSELVADYIGGVRRGGGDVLNSFAVEAGAHWWRRCERNHRGTVNMEKRASFTRPGLVPKAGRGMESWLKRQQVRHKKQGNKNNTHTHTQKEKIANRRIEMSLLQQRESPPTRRQTLRAMLSGIYQVSPWFLYAAARRESAWNK